MPNTGTSGTERRFADQALRFTELETDIYAATAASNAASVNAAIAQITTESLSTAHGSSYTCTITDTMIEAADCVFATVALGTATTGTPVVTTVTPAAGSLVIVIQNNDGSNAFNGTLIVTFCAIKRHVRGI